MCYLEAVERTGRPTPSLFHIHHSFSLPLSLCLPSLSLNVKNSQHQMDSWKEYGQWPVGSTDVFVIPLQAGKPNHEHLKYILRLA